MAKPYSSIVFKALLLVFLLIPLCGFFIQKNDAPEWGFFGHKRINRLAVFTLPQEMLPLYKGQIEFITEHAVDPDKRRYATKHEAVRHYIDIDHWGELPFDNVPRDFELALIVFSEVYGVTERGDTIKALWDQIPGGRRLITKHKGLSKLRFVDFSEYFSGELMPKYYDGPIFAADSLNRFLGDHPFKSIFVLDRFSEHGILPYNLIAYQEKLTRAFTTNDMERVLRLSTEIGHYIGDAHVPLHTTSNYNGQLTDQVGIHGFWESRIPELFADLTYDYLVGPAQLIEDIPSFYWSMVLKSHSLVDSVLRVEKRLSKTFPADQQYCFEDRNFRNVSQACPAYAEAFSEAMGGMVEERFRESILAVGSAWYTAWYNAGRPDLWTWRNQPLASAVDSTDIIQSQGKIYGRQHWD